MVKRRCVKGGVHIFILTAGTGGLGYRDPTLALRWSMHVV